MHGKSHSKPKIPKIRIFMIALFKNKRGLGVLGKLFGIIF